MMKRTIARMLVALAVLSSSSPSRADGSPASGQRIYPKCGACHPIGADGRHGVGPNLRGVVGRKAASRPGFAYSAALRQSQIYWTDSELRVVMRRPKDLIKGCGGPGNLGLRNPQEVEDVLAYLKSLK